MRCLSGCCAGGLYLKAAKDLPTEEDARRMVLAQNAQEQGRLAEEMLAERIRLTGADLGPGGGPGLRHQSPGLPCASCLFLRRVVARCVVFRVCFWLRSWWWLSCKQGVHDYGVACPEVCRLSFLWCARFVCAIRGLGIR